MQYSGNQIKTVVDWSRSKNAKQTKEYQDYATNNEFTYDANGNLTRDLDRNIESIVYNELNLPTKIIFTNGNMIENYYSGDGIKYRSVISTRKTTTSIARVNGRYRRVSRVSYSTLSRYYIGNEEYTQTDDGAITLTRVHNAIGYVVPSSDYKTVSGWYHYAKDYLGNVRELYRVNPNDSRALSLQRYAGVMGSSNALAAAKLASQVQQLCCTLVQSLGYYPSGLPLDNCTNADEQPYKYTGKEFVEEHGLDEYDNGARWYYPALARTGTMDPHCENYYDQSPYSWCGNNFVNVVDPDGADTVNINYNNVNNRWEILKPAIAEGNDVFNIIDKNGSFASYEFSDGEYGNRMNIAILEDNVDIDESFGVYHLSGTEDVGYFVQPSSKPQNEDHYNVQGKYSTYIGEGPRWTTYIGLSGNGATPGVRVHYGKGRSWSTGCLIISSDYFTKSDGSIGFDLGASREAAWGFAQYAGAIKRENKPMPVYSTKRFRDWYTYGRFRAPTINIK